MDQVDFLSSMMTSLDSTESLAKLNPSLLQAPTPAAGSQHKGASLPTPSQSSSSSTPLSLISTAANTLSLPITTFPPLLLNGSLQGGGESGDDVVADAVEPPDEGNRSVLPPDMRFGESHVLLIACYSCIFVVSLVGNLCVLRAILCGGRKQRKSRVNLMLLHLAVADLIVTAVMIPVEVGWAATVEWTAGDGLCRLFAFFRIFGHYLSSFVLVCISIDRYFAVVHPMSLNAADRRGRIMLGFAWCLAVTCSLPQVIIFHVERHPHHTDYVQCVTFNFYPTDQHEMAYNLFCLIMLYVAPLTLIIALYGAIVVTIFQKSRLSADDPALRRSSVGFLGRARVRTIKMTVSIVAAFFVCWTPYVIISLWFCFDRKAAERLDLRVQKALFIFACTNSCANPIVYGIFNFCKGTTPKTQTWRSNASRTTHLSRSLTGRRRLSGGGGVGGGGGIGGWGRPDSLADSSEATELTAELQPRGLSTPGEPRFHRCSCRSGKKSTTPTHTLTTSGFKNGAFFSASASCPLHPHANGSAL